MQCSEYMEKYNKNTSFNKLHTTRNIFVDQKLSGLSDLFSLSLAEICSCSLQEGPRSSVWKRDYDKTRRFRDEWIEKFPWVQRDPEEERFGFCPHCNIRLEPKAKRLEDHERTAKHLKNSGTKLSSLKSYGRKKFRGRRRKFRRVSF